jgi:hypothetical protein
VAEPLPLLTRPIDMRLFLGLLVALTLLLTGCGDTQDGTADDPAASPPTTERTTEEPADSPSEPTLVTLISQSEVGGEVAELAVPVDDAQARAAFTAQFTDERMPEALAEAVAGATVAEGERFLAAVVSIGCVPPEDDDVTVEQAGGDVLVTAAVVKDKGVQCLVPVTTVALVAAG